MAMLGVCQIMLVVVCLLFKTDIMICFHHIPVFCQEEEPLDEIPDIEGYEEHFSLLQCMDAFMIDKMRRQHSLVLSCKNNTENIYCKKRREGYVFVVYYLHISAGGRT